MSTILRCKNTTLVLPSADFDDTIKPSVLVNQMKSVNNTRYTYIRRTGKRRLEFVLDVTLAQAIMIQNFFELYMTNEIRITDHREDVWLGYFVDLALPTSYHMRGEFGKVTMHFDVRKIHAATVNC